MLCRLPVVITDVVSSDAHLAVTPRTLLDRILLTEIMLFQSCVPWYQSSGFHRLKRANPITALDLAGHCPLDRRDRTYSHRPTCPFRIFLPQNFLFTLPSCCALHNKWISRQADDHY